MIIYLVSISPKNGVELMDGVESMTRGWWRPTPGSIYPLLREMTENGILRKLGDGKYDLTSKGRTQAEIYGGPRMRHPRSVTETVGQIRSLMEYLEDLKQSDKDDLSSIDKDLEELGRRISALRTRESKEES
jgi:DNA-binding PadR family transcriptional regulator